MAHPEVTFEWVQGPRISASQLAECSTLYSAHYGTYGPGDSRHAAGSHVKMSATRIGTLLSNEGAWAAFARSNGDLIAYALMVRDSLSPSRIITWVTQLVVHADFRNQKVATRLLHAAWGLSDMAAWGLATANPYAVRALEAATRRRCDPAVIERHWRDLASFASERINYLRDVAYIVDTSQSIVDTKFFVSHVNIEAMMNQCSDASKPWALGNVAPGQEWLAFTFQEQNPTALTAEEFQRLLADYDSIVKEAYGRMTLDTSHVWMRHASAEVDFAIRELDLELGQCVLDAGCGAGRHSVELARRGFRVTGVDFVPELIHKASEEAREAGVHDCVNFHVADCRTMRFDVEFDGVLCLYDVIGSFPKDEDNLALLRTLADHLKRGRRILLSVMNRGLVEAQAIHKGPIFENLATLVQLPPSQLMQASGEIFDPNYYFLDTATSLVYRKEQFNLGNQLPCELIVRDRRYSDSDLEALCRAAGIRPIWTRYVRAGRWDENGDPAAAKEILLLGEKL